MEQFNTAYGVPRVDVTLLREGLNTIRGLVNVSLHNKDASIADLQTCLMEIEQTALAVMWKLQEAEDAGLTPPMAVGGMTQ